MIDKLGKISVGILSEDNIPLRKVMIATNILFFLCTALRNHILGWLFNLSWGLVILKLIYKEKYINKSKFFWYYIIFFIFLIAVNIFVRINY